MQRLLLAIAMMAAPLGLSAEPVTVFAAASLKPVLDVVLADAPVESRAVYAGSSALARQIVAGAPADVFISANLDWMAHVENEGRIVPGSDRVIATNRLVVVGQPGSPPLDRSSLASLADGRVATALTEAVPAGIYARAALETLDLWDELRPSLVEAPDVRAALRLVMIGAVPNGIVYASDAHSAPEVEIRYVFPEDSHPPILYAGAVVTGAGAAARNVLDHIADADAAFLAAGFDDDPPE